MKYLFFLLIISITKLFFSESHFYNEQKNYFHLKEVTLKDGEEFNVINNLDLTFSSNSNAYTYNDLLADSILLENKSLTFNKKAVIRSFENENNNANDLIAYINRIAIGRGLGYDNILNNAITITDWRYAFFFPGGYNWEKIDNFSLYYHSLFKSKSARSLLFDESLGIVKNMCKVVPNDFRKRIIDELDALLTFSNKLPKLSYSVSSEFSDYWEGFIYRRYFIDKIPVSEIQSSIIRAKKELNEIYLDKEFAYKLIVNNKIEILISYDKFIIKSMVNNKELKFEKTHLKKIKYFKDNESTYYQVINSRNLNKPDNDKKILFDENLKAIE